MAIMADVDRGADALAKNALQIWNYAEVGFQETKSSALLQQELKTAGFTVDARPTTELPKISVMWYKSPRKLSVFWDFLAP